MKKNISVNDLQRYITRIYDAGLDETQWPGTLEYLSGEFKAEQSILRVLTPDERRVNQVHTYNKNTAWDEPYRDHYVHCDPWLDLFSNSSKSTITCTHHHLDDKHYEKLEFYNDFVKPQHFHHGLGGLIKVDRYNDAYLIFHRRKSKSTFNDDELGLLKILAPHIRRSLLMADKTRNIEVEKHLLQDALNRINSPLLLVDKNEQIIFINQLAEKLIHDQHQVTIKNNRLLLFSQHHQKLLQQLISQSTQRDTSGRLRKGGGMNYSIANTSSTLYFVVSPINPEQVNFSNRYTDCALVLLSNRECNAEIKTDILKELYNFTSAEARLSIEMCLGLTLDEIAQKFSLSKNTLRSQLRSCFRKTGVDRQSALVNFIKNGPAEKVN